jgi:hypothetical protein
MFVVKSEVIKELLCDEKWRRRLEAAKTIKEAEEVIRQFAKSRGWKVEEVMLLNDQSSRLPV